VGASLEVVELVLDATVISIGEEEDAGAAGGLNCCTITVREKVWDGDALKLIGLICLLLEIAVTSRLGS